MTHQAPIVKPTEIEINLQFGCHNMKTFTKECAFQTGFDLILNDFVTKDLQRVL